LYYRVTQTIELVPKTEKFAQSVALAFSQLKARGCSCAHIYMYSVQYGAYITLPSFTDYSNYLPTLLA